MTGSRTSDPTDQVASSFRWALSVPLAERGYKGSAKILKRRNDDLYFWLQLLGRARLDDNQRFFSLVGGVAVESCLPFTRDPSKPFGMTQLSVLWQTMNYEFNPTLAPDSGRGTLTSVEDLLAELNTQRDRFLAEIDDPIHTTDDVREHLWGRFTGGGRIFNVRHLAFLLASAGDPERLDEVRDRIYSNLAKNGVHPTETEWASFFDAMQQRATA